MKCLICSQPMRLEKKFKNVQGRQNVYRMRRFKCSFCEYSETICADGKIDIIDNPNNAIEDVKLMFKQEREARI